MIKVISIDLHSESRILHKRNNSINEQHRKVSARVLLLEKFENKPLCVYAKQQTWFVNNSFMNNSSILWFAFSVISHCCRQHKPTQVFSCCHKIKCNSEQGLVTVATKLILERLCSLPFMRNGISQRTSFQTANTGSLALVIQPPNSISNKINFISYVKKWRASALGDCLICRDT